MYQMCVQVRGQLVAVGCLLPARGIKLRLSGSAICHSWEGEAVSVGSPLFHGDAGSEYEKSAMQEQDNPELLRNSQDHLPRRPLVMQIGTWNLLNCSPHSSPGRRDIHVEYNLHSCAQWP